MNTAACDLRTVIDQYHATGAVSNDVWYDWFCKDSQLKKRGSRLAQVLSFFVAREKMDEAYMADKFVFFKNCCPLNGKLYDCVAICRKSDNEVLFYIEDQINDARGKGVWLYNAATGFEMDNRTALPLSQ